MDNALNELLRGEIIGLKTRVLNTKIKGRIIDETKNTFLIETDDKKLKTVIKGSNEFEFCLNGRKITINGKQMSLRPEDRIKLKVKS